MNISEYKKDRKARLADPSNEYNTFGRDQFKNANTGSEVRMVSEKWDTNKNIFIMPDFDEGDSKEKGIEEDSPFVCREFRSVDASLTLPIEEGEYFTDLGQLSYSFVERLERTCWNVGGFEYRGVKWWLQNTRNESTL